MIFDDLKIIFSYHIKNEKNRFFLLNKSITVAIMMAQVANLASNSFQLYSFLIVQVYVPSSVLGCSLPQICECMRLPQFPRTSKPAPVRWLEFGKRNRKA